MAPPTLSIRFCGGCNPRIDRGGIALELGCKLEKMGFRMVDNSLDADFVIFLSGCTSGCAFKFNPTAAPFIEVAGATVDSIELREGEDAIVSEVMGKINRHFPGRYA